MSSNFENAILTPIIPFLFTLFVFGLTRLLDYRREQLRIRRDLIRSEIFVKKWLELIELQVVKQIDTITKLLDNFKQNKFENFVQFNLMSEKLSIISSKERLILFAINRGGDFKKMSTHYYEFEIYAENLKGLQNNIEKAFGYSRTAILEIFAEWDECMHDLNDSIDHLLLPMPENEEVKVILDELNLIVSSLSGNVGIPIPVLKKQLIDPVDNLLNRLYLLRKYDDLFYLTSKTIRKLNILVIKYNNAKETSINQFEELSSSLASNVLKIKNIGSEIFNFKLKYFLTLK